MSSKAGEKRKNDSGSDSDSADECIGPMPSDMTKKPTKKRILKDADIHLRVLPDSSTYERSFMHRDVVIRTRVSNEFVVTASVDGHVKFWKKRQIGVEFVKHFRAHLGNISDIAVNHNGSLLATASDEDCHVKVFDVINFDMINIIRLGKEFPPSNIEWIHGPGDALMALAVVSANVVRIYDGREGKPEPIKTLDKIHMQNITCLKYNAQSDVIVSADESGFIEYWAGFSGDFDFPHKKVMFESKLDTDLFELAKNKTKALNLSVSPNGKLLAAFCADKRVRIFRFLSGKIYCVIDESLQHYLELQQVNQKIPAMEFNRKIAVEKEIERNESLMKMNNVCFDKSSNFIVYSSLAGIKIVNVYSNEGARIVGAPENLRFLNVSLFQGLIKNTTAATSLEVEASDNPGLDEGVCDPTLFVTAFKKNRFYLFTRREPKDYSDSGTERDVFNEKPSKEDIIHATSDADKAESRLFEMATIHTSVGDIHVQLFPRECPKSVENFCVHAKNNYYNGHIFHRVIKQFMVQTGDPLGIGTGGESIWGGEFEDEFHPRLKHDRPYTLSMANAGPNTNGSQFFVTVVPTPWLDNKHTVFGRVVKGMEVVQNICNVKTHPKTDKPYDDITMISVSVKNPFKV